MKFLRFVRFSFLAWVMCCVFSVTSVCDASTVGKISFFPNSTGAKVSYHSLEQTIDSRPVKTLIDGGIRESVPQKYAARYQNWKNEFLSTDFGRSQWERFSLSKNFLLTLVVDESQGQGAGTNDYKWDDSGALVAATIHLGAKLDSGFPDPIYFPVMNSLSLIDFPYELNTNTIAAVKMAHEFGHINLTSQTNGELVRLQNKLIPDYNKILLSNGYDTHDKRLVEIAQRMGGTPVEIWENREYWSEASAMNFLVEKINQTNFYCRIINRIETNVKIYAVAYENRFEQIAQANKPDSCRR